MATTDLATITPQLPSRPNQDTAIAELTKGSGSSFFPQLRLYSKQPQVAEGKIGVGRYGVPEQDGSVTDLGPTIDVQPLAYRCTAIDFSDRNNIVSSHDPESAEFKRIADQKDVKESGCMAGVEFLLAERSTGQIYTFFPCSKTARPQANLIRPYCIGQEKAGPCTLSAIMREMKKDGARIVWHIPGVDKCSLPITNIDTAAAEDAIAKFLSPPKVEEVAPQEGGRVR